ncbi:hypothetical protein BD560DRAFT_387382 [Blakeslea trispora]|nr:hypothetical protein BD560DRAFT_387382 [Blakeslea trispora]
MNITELLLPQQMTDIANMKPTEPILRPQPIQPNSTPIHDDDLMSLWQSALEQSGYLVQTSNERNSLTDAILSSVESRHHGIPVHIKVIGRHMNGSFRCHIGTSKASRPIRSTELFQQMRMLAVFFRAESAKSQLVSPEFIFFPTWLLHLFRYTQHGTTPGRTDVRFLENANMAKEDHIYRLNHVLNTLFRFNIHQFDPFKLKSAIELADFLFDHAGLDYRNLPKPAFFYGQHNSNQPALYPALLLLLHQPRPIKFKPMCFNCNTKPASRRRLCVACYRYQLKHGESRPLRLIVANRPGPRIQQQQQQSLQDNDTLIKPSENSPMVFYSPRASSSRSQQKSCANCKVKETHQWYRNLCGNGHWCETCKSYYLRHTKVRPPELFVKAAKRKVDIRSLVDWNNWSWDEIPVETIESATSSILNNMYYYNNRVQASSPASSNAFLSYPITPPLPPLQLPTDNVTRRSSTYSSNASSPSSLW